jgi:hypothetical protein
MIVIPFLVSHEREAKDAKLPENIIGALTPEFPAIVRVLGEYYIKLKKEHGGVIPVSKESMSYKTEVISELETDLDEFVNVNIIFEKTKMEIIKDVYDKYMSYFDFDGENSVKRNEALSRAKFTKTIIKNYKDYVYKDIQRVRGSAPSRSFIGMRLKTIDEIAAEAAAKEKENTPAQVPVQEHKQALAAEPVEDEKPFD